MSQKEKTILDAVDMMAYVRQLDDDTELLAIRAVLALVTSGRSVELVEGNKKKEALLVSSTKDHFKKNPSDYIVVIGNIRIPRTQVFGVLREYGIPKENIRLYTEYEKIKNNFPYHVIRNDKAKAVFFGSVPHNANGGNGATSPIEAVKAMKPVFVADSLKVTKESLRKCAAAFTAALHEEGVEVS